MAGLVILGMLLVSLVTARARYLEQWSRSGRREQALIAADRLLNSWWPGAVPRRATGTVAGQRMRWDTRIIDSPQAHALGAAVLRLEVFDSDLPETTDAAKALAVVDLLVENAKAAPEAVH
jgi:hypothetical protein